MKATLKPGTTEKGADRHDRRMKALSIADGLTLDEPTRSEPESYEIEITKRARKSGPKLPLKR